ncbi:hypothetical protein BKA61DRAFT_584149 [Leptodontidium sp. MPI-SDFR-AT-0119]|nr:hypothetical protein BKA61DRAFT_584149 [Leptodontidium sp. MPI-SDFR-AT-0119]
MEAISLCSIAVLLNYELMISNPRFKDTRVMKSSFAELAIVDRIKAQYPQLFTTAKASIPSLHLHLSISTLLFPPTYTGTQNHDSNANGGRSISTGAKDDERHCVISFPHPSKPCEDFVVNITRMQYGEKARGPLGENYFMGSGKDFAASFEPICESIKLRVVLGVQTDGIEGEGRLKNCVARAF